MFSCPVFHYIAEVHSNHNRTSAKLRVRLLLFKRWSEHLAIYFILFLGMLQAGRLQKSQGQTRRVFWLDMKGVGQTRRVFWLDMKGILRGTFGPDYYYTNITLCTSI